MTTYFEAPDGHGESTIWVRNPDRPGHPVAIIRSHDVHTHYWPDVVARMTGTTDQLETATVQLKTMSGVVDRLRADMRTWQRAAAERTRERDEIADRVNEITAERDQAADELQRWKAIADHERVMAEIERLRMTGTTITTDDATVQLVAEVLAEEAWQREIRASYDPTMWKTWHGLTPEFQSLERFRFEDRARAILAALTGVPHDR